MNCQCPVCYQWWSKKSWFMIDELWMAGLLIVVIKMMNLEWQDSLGWQCCSLCCEARHRLHAQVCLYSHLMMLTFSSAFTYLSMLKQARKPRSYTIFEILIKWPTSVKSYWRPTGLLSTMMSVLIETQQMLPGSSWTRVFHWKRREGAALHSFHPIL